MRAALFDGISQADMAQIIKSITAKAKQGDLKAADFLFRWILGSPQTVVNVHQTHEVKQEPRVIEVQPREEWGTDPPPDKIAEQATKLRENREARAGRLNGSKP